jgi:TolB protein
VEIWSMPLLAPLRLRSRLAVLLASLLLTTLAVGCAPLGAGAAQVPVPPPVEPVIPAPANVQPVPAVQQVPDVPPGRILYVRDGNLWLWQAGSSRQFSEGGTWFQPAFSPDGKEVAYVYWTFNFSDLFVMAADGSSSRRLTRGQSSSLPDNIWAFRPAWAPDGQRLAYISDANSQLPQVWIMAKDGNNRRQLTSEATGIQWADALSWDPSGARLALTAAPSMRDPSQIYLLDIAKGIPEKLTNHLNGAFDPAFSPDGTAVAYIGRAGAQGELWVRDLEGTHEAHTDKLPNVRSPAWSPDGKSLAVLAPQNGAFEIFILSVRSTADGFELGEPRALTRDGAVDPMSGLTWAP